MAGLGQFLLEIGVDANALQRGLNNAESKIESFGKKAESLGTKLSIAVSAPLGLMAKRAVESFGEMEALKMSLGTLEKTASSLSNRLSELNELAKLPGIGYKEAIQADVRLRSVGISADIAKRAMLGFGNAIATAGGGKAQFDSVIYQLTQMSAKSKVLSQDFRPIIEAVPMVASAVKKLYGTVDTEQIQSKMSAAGINSQQFIEQLITELEKLPKVSGGVKNALENLSDTMFKSFASIGETIDKNVGIKKWADEAGSAMESLAKHFSELTPESQKAILAIGGIAIVLPPLLALAGTILPAISTGFLALISPAGLAGAAIAGAAIYAVSHWEKVEGILYKVKKGLQDTLLGVGLAGAALQGVFNPAGASEQRAKLLSAYSKNVGIDPSIVNQIKSDYQSNKKFMYKKGEKPNTGNVPPPPPSTGLGGDKKSLDGLKKLQSDFLSETRDMQIASILEKYTKEREEAKKAYNDDLKEKQNSIKGKKGFEDELANYTFARKQKLNSDLANIDKEQVSDKLKWEQDLADRTLKISQDVYDAKVKYNELLKKLNKEGVDLLKDYWEKSMPESMMPKEIDKKLQGQLQSTLSNGMRGITQQGDKNTLASILGIDPELINNVNFNEYNQKAKTVVDANQAISDSLRNLAIDSVANMSMIVGQMIVGTATMADLGKMLASTMSQALMDIAKVNIAAGLASLIPSVGPLKLITGIAAGIGSGILGGIGKKSQNKSSSYGQTSYNSVVRGGDIFIAQNRYQTIKGF
jgi:tape measure domain-containing protein